MRVTILGSGTLVPDGRRGPAGHVVQSEQLNLLLDGGTGTLRRLAEAGVDYRQVDHLLYTHVHPDHTGDLVPMLFAQRHTPGQARTRPMWIYGPPGFDDFFTRLMTIYGDWVQSPVYDCIVTELERATRQLADLELTTVPMHHPVPCIGYRLTGPAGESMAYTGDTDETDGVVELARDVDLLIIDCSTPDEHKVDGHLSPGRAGKLAARAGARTVVLSHLYPICEEVDIVAQCRRHYDGAVVVARDLLEFELSPGRTTLELGSKSSG